MPEFTVHALETIRLSRHFMLLDFMFDAHWPYQGGAVEAQDLSSIMQGGRLEEARHLASNLMERLTTLFGPSTIAAGFSPCTESSPSPHCFLPAHGAAVDAVFHDWVRPGASRPEGRAPVEMLNDVRQTQLVFDRLIGYAGTEFMCIADRAAGPRFKVYNNRRYPEFNADLGGQGIVKPEFQTLSRSGKQWTAFRGIDAQPGWRRVEGEPVFHTQRSLRVQHIRTGRYFTLVDFIKSPVGIVNRMKNIPSTRPSRQIKTARMFSEVLDPVVEAVGRITIIRGIEGQAVSNRWQDHETASLHRWNQPLNRIEFIAPEGHDESALLAALDHANVFEVATRENGAGEPIYAVMIRSFEPAVHFTSALSDQGHGAGCRCCA
ncbi:hypothetical protein [Paracoccus sp. MKU1]|uniref:hypothetical protein n=1 Tax=Paracoccus sp. MKU1 TaxID=1745182 RepID=UPI000AA13132|nr:hypothetical protein [Paracoccus sp. MKU1]